MIETRAGGAQRQTVLHRDSDRRYDVLDYLASGITSEQIVSEFPELTDEHVRVAIEFAAMRERRLATPA